MIVIKETIFFFSDYHKPQLNSSITSSNTNENIEIEHWSPWKKTQRYDDPDDEEHTAECHGPISSIDEFPTDLFTRK